MDLKQAGALALAVFVAVTAVAGPAAAATSTVYPSGDDAGLAVQVSWDSSSVSAGDTVDLEIADASAGTVADTATVTVRNASGTDTFWLSQAHYTIPSSSDRTTEVDVVLADSAQGSVGTLDHVDTVASATVETGASEGVSANISVDDGLPTTLEPVDVTVTAYNGSAELGTETVTVDNRTSSYAELNASELGLKQTTNATVVVTDAADAQGSGILSAVSSFDVSTFSSAGAGAGDTSSDTQMYVIGGAAVVLALLLVRD
ncbi:hypothetical protein DJ83_11165 [Halorubrum ezzemoulense]|uniref:Uncharacterized protein n=1 Tax=Halorubrum ezzemoulense TaxID=337243 RepID=A0A256ITJ0_HALEZ|nr:hypothetical protein DJ83_11165 [Halorubrum ezzemoulense]